MTHLVACRDVTPGEGFVVELLGQQGGGVTSLGSVVVDFQKMPADRPISKSCALAGSSTIHIRVLYSTSLVSHLRKLRDVKLTGRA